jgi:hypothetical protein
MKRLLTGYLRQGMIYVVVPAADAVADDGDDWHIAREERASRYSP